MEIWKDIKGYEGLYQVSNLGRVKSLDRTVFNKGNNSLCKLRGQEVYKVLTASLIYIRSYAEQDGLGYTIDSI